MPTPSPVTLGGGHFVEEDYEHLWIIPRWSQVRQSDDLLKNHAWKFETAGTASKVETTWQVEWKIVPISGGSRTKSCEVHWTLINMKGMTGESLIGKIKTSVIKNNRDGSSDLEYQSDEQQRYFRLNEPVEISFFWISEDVIKPEGNLSVQLNLTLVLPKRNHLEPDVQTDLSESENEEVPEVDRQAEKASKLSKRKNVAPALRWHDEWHQTETAGSGNVDGNGGGGAGTSAQARASGSDNGSKGAKQSKRNGRKGAKQSKRNGGGGAGTSAQARASGSHNGIIGAKQSKRNGGGGAGTSAQARASGSDNGRIGAKQSKRNGENDLLLNQKAKKLKLDYWQHVKKEVEQD